MTTHHRILLTGAAGSLGTVLREALAGRARVLRVTDRQPLTARGDHEEAVTCDLGDANETESLTRDVDAVVHMGGAVGAALPFSEVLHSNYLAFHNLFEACRRNGVKRVVWGSSNHAIGFYPRTQRIDSTVTPRPDSDYGVSKVFGEAMAQYYWDKFGLETVSLRIGSCFPEPTDRRMLTTWLSYPDLVHLVECGLNAPRVEHTIIYGVSNNDSVLWDNRTAMHLGFRPKDNAEAFRAKVEAGTAPYDSGDLAIAVHGGSYAATGSTLAVGRL